MTKAWYIDHRDKIRNPPEPPTGIPLREGGSHVTVVERIKWKQQHTLYLRREREKKGSKGIIKRMVDLTEDAFFNRNKIGRAHV